MATIKGTLQTVFDAGSGVGSNLLGGIRDARVKACIDFYTLAGSEASGTVIEVFGELPAGANILSISLNFSAAQTSLTLSIGDAASATRYASASTGPQTAGETRVHGKGYVIGTNSGDNQIQLLTGGATATAATLVAVILYTTD